MGRRNISEVFSHVSCFAQPFNDTDAILGDDQAATACRGSVGEGNGAKTAYNQVFPTILMTGDKFLPI